MPTPALPGTQGQQVLAAHPQGLAAPRGTAPDTRRPSQRWKATPQGSAPHHPRGTQPPAGHASEGDSAGPPHPHTSAHSKWVADTDSPPRPRHVERSGPLQAQESHRRSAPHPLLSGTATQQWRSPWPHSKRARDLRRWTRRRRSSGLLDSEAVTGTPPPEDADADSDVQMLPEAPAAARPRGLRRRRAACPPSAPRGSRATAPGKAGAPGNTPDPLPMTGRCPRWGTRPHAPPCPTA